MDPQRLLEQFLGADLGQDAANAASSAKEKLEDSGLNGLAGGLAAGGLLGLLVGNKKMRKKVGKLAGGVVGYGGAAALGAIGYRAYQNWQANRPVGESKVLAAADPSPPEAPPAGSRFLAHTLPARDGQPFELALVTAMIVAANADGHIGPEEQRTIFARVNELALDAEDKALVFDTLSNPPSLQDVADKAHGLEQAAELYLASRLAIDPDHPAEQAYLEALASRLSLPADLVAQLDSQADARA